MSSAIITEAYAQFIAQTFGEPGQRWLAELPARLAQWSERWGLTYGEPFGLSYNYVLPARRADGSEVVLKAGVPHPEFISEIEALRIYDGHGIARLYEADAEAGVMLLERLRPGTMLSTLPDDDESMRIAAGVMQKLWRPLTVEQARHFPDLRRWTQAIAQVRAEFPDRSGPFPSGLLDLAEGLLAELLASAGETVLLHGDLHHFNILQAEREPWLAIDPKGLAGEREFDVSALMHNPWGRLAHWPDLPGQMARRASILAEALGLERQRLLAWSVTGMMLSICWSYQEQRANWADELLIVEAMRVAGGY